MVFTLVTLVVNSVFSFLFSSFDLTRFSSTSNNCFFNSLTSSLLNCNSLFNSLYTVVVIVEVFDLFDRFGLRAGEFVFCV